MTARPDHHPERDQARRAAAALLIAVASDTCDPNFEPIFEQLVDGLDPRALVAAVTAFAAVFMQKLAVDHGDQYVTELIAACFHPVDNL